MAKTKVVRETTKWRRSEATVKEHPLKTSTFFDNLFISFLSLFISLTKLKDIN